MQVVLYQSHHFEEVDRLWKVVFPSDPARNQAVNSIPMKLSLNDGLFFVAEDADGRVIGTTMAGWDGHRGWLYNVAVDPSLQGSGVGKLLVEHAMEALRGLGCTKVNLQIREGNESVTRFYQSLGFEKEPRTSMGRSL